MYATLPIVQLYTKNYLVFYNATEHLSHVLQQHILETIQGQDRRLLELMLANEDDFGSRLISMYGFCTTPLCKAAKRLMCAHLVRQLSDPLHMMAMWGNAPGRSHPYSGCFPEHVPFTADLKKIRHVFHDLSVPTVDLAWFVRLELRYRQPSDDSFCWGENAQSVLDALRQACKGSKDHMITLSRFVRQEVRKAGKTVRFQKMTPQRPLEVQAEESMLRLESPHPGHANIFLQLRSLLSRISRTTMQNRMNAICTALEDFARVQPWPKQNSKPRLELHWTIRHLMMARCRGMFDPIEIEEAMEIANHISRNESDPLQRLRLFAAH